MSEAQKLRGNVTMRPATRQMYTSMPINSTVKRRVTGYARVSTDSKEQEESYEAQVEYYTEYIQARADWEFIPIYSDEGITGTNTRKREGFNDMIRDALAGKFDLIVAKSISRFARNTVDSLVYVRRLKEAGVEVYFQKENLYSFDPKAEMLLTILSSLAQEESRSISENVQWGKRKRFADGKVTMAYGRFLGYEKGPDGTPKIVEKEADVIRLIYHLFLRGKTTRGIANQLTEAGIRTPGGKDKWCPSTVENILKNEKYKGDALLQKTYTADFLTKKMKVNNGEVPQYYVEGSHPAIIDKETFDRVEAEFERRKRLGGSYSGQSCFSSRIVCGECGGLYGSKVWYSNTKYRRTIWRCNRKYDKVDACRMPHVSEDEVKRAFVDVFNRLLPDREAIIAAYRVAIAEVMDTTALTNEQERVEAKMAELEGQMQHNIHMNARVAQDQAEYNARHEVLAREYQQLVSRRTSILDELADRERRGAGIEAYLGALEVADGLLTEFDERLWNLMVEKVTVEAGKRFLFAMADGSEMEWI